MKNSHNKFNWDGNFVRAVELLFDLIVIIISLLFIYMLKIYVNDVESIDSLIGLFIDAQNYMMLPNAVYANVIYIIITMSLVVLYEASIIRKKYFDAFTSLILSLFLGFVILIILNYIFLIDVMSPITILGLFIVEIIIFAPVKYFEHRFIYKRLKIRVLLIGTDDDLQNYFLKFRKSLPIGRELKFVYKFDITNDDILNDKILEILNKVEMIYLLPSIPDDAKDEIIKYTFGNKNISIGLVPDLYEVGLMKSQFEMINDVMISKIKPLQLSFLNTILKRLFDIFASIIALSLLAPVFLVVSILIKIEDRGPILYKQLRVTKNDRKFNIYKFRSMVVDAEKDTGAIQARENDNRITKIGKFLRRIRLDEIPQLINVLMGQMSIVGPRSLRVEEVEEYSKLNPNFKFRLNVKAGITGMAQIYGNYVTKPDEKLRLDIYYIKNFSFWLDLKLILLTIRTIFDRSSTKGVEVYSDDYYEVIEKLFIK